MALGTLHNSGARSRTRASNQAFSKAKEAVVSDIGLTHEARAIRDAK
jgi:hypothetical protein